MTIQTFSQWRDQGKALLECSTLNDRRGEHFDAAICASLLRQHLQRQMPLLQATMVHTSTRTTAGSFLSEQNTKTTEQLIQATEDRATQPYLLSKILYANLQWVDSHLPKMLCLSIPFLHQNIPTTLQHLAQQLEEHDPLTYYTPMRTNQQLYTNKLQRLVLSLVLGMNAEEPFYGEVELNSDIVMQTENQSAHIYSARMVADVAMEMVGVSYLKDESQSI